MRGTFLEVPHDKGNSILESIFLSPAVGELPHVKSDFRWE